MVNLATNDSISAHILTGELRLSASQDVNTHAQSLNGWNQQYDQLACGCFAGELAQLSLGGLQIFREQTSLAVRQVCKIPLGSIWCGVTVKHDGSRIEGQELGANGIMICAEPGEFELLTPDGHDILGLVVPTSILRAYALSSSVALMPERVGSASWLECEANTHQRLRATLLFALQSFSPDSCAHNQAPSARSQRVLAQTALDALLAVFDAQSGNRAPRRSCAGLERHRKVVRRVCEYTLGHLDDLPTVPELCAKVFVSRRTLQYAFEDCVGCSPVAYLRSLRLNAAKRKIQTGQGVQDAAWACGFLSLSQFSSDYRLQFGERPSDTLAKAKASK